MRTHRCVFTFRHVLNAATTLLAMMALTSHGLAAGALLSGPDDNSAITSHRALVVWRADEVELHLELTLQNASPELFWLFAVPATPSIASGDAEVFDALQALTAPTIELGAATAASGCASSSEVDSPTTYRPDPPASFQSETRTVAATTEILTATTTEKLVEQLSNRNIPVDDDAVALLESYVAQRMVFVLARLETAAGDATSRFGPLVMSFARPASSAITYALGLSARASAQPHPSQLYQLSDRRYRISNYGSLSFDRVAEALRDTWRQTGNADYDATLDALTADAGGRLAVTEFAAELTASELPTTLSDLIDEQASYLTRFYLRPRAEHMVDLELRFGADGPDEDGVARVSPDDAMAMWLRIPLWLMFFAALGLGVHRRQLKGALKGRHEGRFA